MGYQLAICQKYAANIHGYTDESSPQIYDHYLCLYIVNVFTLDEFSFAINVANKSHNQYLRNPTQKKKKTRITIEIVETVAIQPGNETVAIYKTFWLRIFQRKVRKWIELKQKVNALVESNQICKMMMIQEYKGGNNYDLRRIITNS
jgi:hypothetical protein